MDQMLERLAGNEFYCFLDGFSGYFQIPIDLCDQEKTTFTCPYGTFAYRHIPFGLYNAPGMFQRCMLAIFHDMVEKTMEVFMDDFSVFGKSFENYLSRLDKMLQRCDDTNLCLNREKSHFMVKEGIVLGHKISKNRIEVDRAKVDVIAKLPYPTTVKGENHASWSDKLDNALWAFRTAYKTPIGYTPYKLVHGKSCHLPIELEHKAYWALKQANFDLAVAGKKEENPKIKNRVFNVGDRVLLFNSRLKIFSGKLKTRWSGPFTITKVFPYGTVELSQANGPNFKVNGHRFKHYFEGDVPQLDCPDCEVSRALSFVLYSQELHIISFILGIHRGRLRFLVFLSAYFIALRGDTQHLSMGDFEVRTAITNDSTGSSKPSKERFKEFANNSGVVGGERFRFNPFRQVIDGHEIAPMAKSLASHISSKEEEWGIFFKKTSHRPGYLWKILYESSIEAGMTEETTDTLDGSRM
nr:reverse transcriptase domain-containing protein [Tanacetum cinerariifolium]